MSGFKDVSNRQIRPLSPFSLGICLALPRYPPSFAQAPRITLGPLSPFEGHVSFSRSIKMFSTSFKKSWESSGTCSKSSKIDFLTSMSDFREILTSLPEAVENLKSFAVFCLCLSGDFNLSLSFSLILTPPSFDIKLGTSNFFFKAGETPMPDTLTLFLTSLDSLLSS